MQSAIGKIQLLGSRLLAPNWKQSVVLPQLDKQGWLIGWSQVSCVLHPLKELKQASMPAPHPAQCKCLKIFTQHQAYRTLVHI